MKPTRDTALITIVTAIIGGVTVLAVNFSQQLALAIPEVFGYGITLVPVICFAWFMLFAISILNYTQERPFVLNVFITYLAYTTLQHIINIGIGLLGLTADKVIMYYQVSGTINSLGVILLVIAVFMLRDTPYRLSLQLFALSELFIMLFYLAVPMLLSAIHITDMTLYFRYGGLSYMVVSAAELYVAITVLNLSSRQEWQKPFYQTEKPDWPPYNKPGL